MVNVTTEIGFKTFRSGGKGGQNVNKVETAVEGSLHIAGSKLLTGEQKVLIAERLQNRINGEGFLLVRSQEHRTQLANKQEVIAKINRLIAGALKKKKPRIATQPGAAARERRIDNKKRKSESKQWRKKIRPE